MESFDVFISKVKRWGEQSKEINAIILVGSYARGTHSKSSDIDLVILTNDKENMISNPMFINQFGKQSKMGIEYYGAVTSIRVFYEEGFEVEFGIAEISWIAQPLDSGTRQILDEGYKVIIDKGNYFESIKKEISMLFVTSKDGTKIAFEKSGQGEAVLIIGGALADHHNYVPLAINLSSQFEVYNIDRRGRGKSTDTMPYTIEREVEDIQAIINSIGKPVTLYGHSSGSALAILVAARGNNVSNLVIADTPFTPHGIEDDKSIASFKEEIDIIQNFHDNNDFRGSATFFLSGFGLTVEEVEGILNSPEGEGMIKIARTLLYDYIILGDGLVPFYLASKISIPTLILASKDMPETAEALAQIIPNSLFKSMESSVHELTPEALTEVIFKFLK